MSSYTLGRSYTEASDVNRAVAHFFDLCATSTGTNCAWTEPAGGARTGATLLQKYSDWIGIVPLAVNRGRTSDLTETQSFTIRYLVHNTLKLPNDFKKLAAILQEWYADKTKIRDFYPGETVQNYPQPKPVTKRQDSGTVSPNYDPSLAVKVTTVNNLNAIRCVDNELRPTDLSATYYQTWFNEFAQRNVYSNDVSMGYIYVCAPWKIQPTNSWQGTRWTVNGFKTAKPIMFVQTFYDSVTPQQSAVNAASFYEGAKVIYTNGAGVGTGTLYLMDIANLVLSIVPMRTRRMI